jgi:Cytochrome P460
MLRISRKLISIAAIGVAAFGGAVFAAQDRYSLQVPDGIAFAEFKGYDTWQVVSVSNSATITDVILGNPAAVEAYKSGIPANGKPFPDGARLAKIHWNGKKFSDAFPVQSPGTLHDIDFMVRDSKRFTNPDHWGFAQFNYDDKSQSFSPLGRGTGCGTACHQAAVSRDYVFTEYPTR